jgi:hypothetical protein
MVIQGRAFREMKNVSIDESFWNIFHDTDIPTQHLFSPIRRIFVIHIHHIK